jgi:hypothetical protein
MRSCRRLRPRDRKRGKGIARPEQPREPKQSWRAQAPQAWMCAIATARQVCWAPDSEQAQSRLAWAWTVPRDRCDLDHPVVAWPGVAVISSLPAPALLPFVRTGSEVCVEARARNPCQSIRVGLSAAGACFWAKALAGRALMPVAAEPADLSMTATSNGRRLWVGGRSLEAMTPPEALLFFVFGVDPARWVARRAQTQGLCQSRRPDRHRCSSD